MARDPRIERQFPDRVQDLLSSNQVLAYRGGRITLREVNRGREANGAITYTAVFDVLEPDPDREWLTPPVYCTTEFLAACAIEQGQMTPADSADSSAHQQQHLSDLPGLET
jgi:hypothetical protein